MVLSEMDAIAFAREAEKEVRALDSPTQARLRRNLARLAEGAAGLDIKPLAGREPWKRLRIGDSRVILREVDEAEHARYRWLVARVVNRRDLERAIKTL